MLIDKSDLIDDLLDTTGHYLTDGAQLQVAVNVVDHLEL